MSSPSKQKGTAAETLVAKWFRVNGFPGADRKVMRGSKDEGDLDICPGIIAEVKNVNLTTGFPSDGQLQGWLDETHAEWVNAGADHAVLIVKRRGTQDVGKWFLFEVDGKFWSMTTVGQWAESARKHGYGTEWEESA